MYRRPEAPLAFALVPDPPVERAEVRPGVELAYWRAMPARPPGFPLLLVHGWPEAKRIWARNVEPLAAAGFEVIVPDLRGFGDSGLAPDGFYDLAAHARDLHALVAGVLGHERCAASGGDLGGGVIQDLALRFEGFVARQVLFNTILPLLPEAYEAAGIPLEPPRGVRCRRPTRRPGPRRRRRARCAWRPTTSYVRGATRTVSPPSSTRRTGA